MRSPKPIYLYVAFLVLLVILFHAAIWIFGTVYRLSANQFALLGAFLLLQVASAYFSLEISLRTSIVVDASLVFASILLFGPPWPSVIASFAVILRSLLFRRPLIDSLVNASIRHVEVSSVQIIYLMLGGELPVPLNIEHYIFPVFSAVVVYIVVNRFLVAMAVAIFQGVNLKELLLSAWERGLKEDISLLLMGILTALVVEVQPWALLLAVIPVGIVYIALRNSLRLEVLTLEAVERMADVIDYRDPYTAGHSQRVAELAEKIAKAMGLPTDEVRTVRAAARVHDLGKIAIDAGVLNKPGRLSDEEWGLMRRHPLLGAEIISRFPEFARGADYVRYHHERWDGKGYPFGLRGEEIPLGARIIAVADSYDAMATDRPYRKRLTQDVIMQEFRRGAGVQWDPQVVKAFLNVMGEKETRGEGPAPDRAWAPT